MVSITSRKTYKEIAAEGLVGRQALEILEAIIDMGQAMSLREIERTTGIPINAVSGRVNDLKVAGYLCEVDKRKCRISGRLITPVLTTGFVESVRSW